MNGRKVTTKAKDSFIERLRATGGNVSRAAESGGFSRSSAYEHRKEDPAFAAAWDAAIESGIDDLVEAMRSHAMKMDGNSSVRAAEFLIKAKRPEYRERMTQDLNVRLSELSDEELEKLKNGETI